ncbi:P-loop NTPase family protein [Cuniculiplasma divulgatum]|jgi:hypothetical protein|uniref:Uncharacterized protein n=1 Tax=Cuniculiplasma divulgatum TaxID=1673428 RepID=A0A1R4A769_9ARCH|nr:hypothetical protein [Cuniculiplasma divulgatum]MCI2411913.1 hypothetical protein [Cuniculiplasma sp.]WMT49102.1 MAG: hypothetical protein RE472_08525 [Thermoplasmatales archaeon]SJK84818.1 hypothetical protein CPM_0980 [Cuniculiplasma divulgatum]
MDKRRKIIISILVALIVVTSGLVYYNSFVNEHTKSQIGLDFTIKTIEINGQNKLQINISAVINSTNDLTKFSFAENKDAEGIDLVYLGNNSTYANQLLNLSLNFQNPYFSSNLEAFDHYVITNKKTKYSSVWNETVFNCSKSSFQVAPYGYYIPSVSLVSSGPFAYILNVTKCLVLLTHNGIELVRGIVDS